jgi:hypothetical protein
LASLPSKPHVSHQRKKVHQNGSGSPCPSSKGMKYVMVRTEMKRTEDWTNQPKS